MEQEIRKNNWATVVGKAKSGFVYSHTMYGEKFYELEIVAKRFSGFEDKIVVLVSERMVDVSQPLDAEQYIWVEGSYRSYNQRESGKNRLILTLFAQKLEIVSEIPSEILEGSKNNQIALNGYVCKQPVYRKTPLGREIADLLIAVNRAYGKSDYIPCITWGRNARFASKFEIGSPIQIEGRIQSREYVKKLSETETERRIAYEVSVSKIIPLASEEILTQ